MPVLRVVLVAFFLLLQVDAKSSCDVGWLDASSVAMGCLLFNSSAPLTWLEANARCQDYGHARLVEVYDDLQLDFLAMELSLLDDQGQDGHHWWTAGNDIGCEGNWTWMGSHISVEEYMWGSNHPAENTASNCLGLFYGLDYRGVDIPCRATSYPICQKFAYISFD